MKAMILAAGLGTRLRPLTLTTPKPLIPVRGYPLIAYALGLLKKHGLTDVLINIHHLGDLIEHRLGDGRRFGMQLAYSRESRILGTGGGIKKAESFFQGQTCIVLNADVLMDPPLEDILAFHRIASHGAPGPDRAIATMVVRPRGEESPHSRVLMEEGRICEIGASGPRPGKTSVVYTGLQILEPEFFRYLPADKPSCLIQDGYQKVLADGHSVRGFSYEGYWSDLGTMESYRQAEEELGGVSFSFGPLSI